MNKTALKNFATNARKELIDKVKAKAFRIGINEESIKKAQFESSDAIYIHGKQLSATEKKQREKLIYRINEIGYKQVMEEVAYTWFNRFTALRFMEVNDYLPAKVRVLSSSNADSSEPDIIKEAMTVDLDIDKEVVYGLKVNNKTEELFKYLVIKQCNSLNNVLPFMFETIDDYKEILFPDGLLAKDSFLREMTNVTSIPESDWEQVEVIGWLYQFYISDEKDRVFKEKAKFKSEEIPYATQLFTPDWIVRYMVQNSLGRYWVEAHSEHSSLTDNWEFYLEDQDRKSEIEKKLASFVNKELNVESIKCFDPAMGSGHILVYMFDVLYEIYTKCGYMEREIPKLIIENNLFGLDIDDRAYQLACFSVVMKAMEYNKRFFRSIEKEGLKLNLASIQETNSLGNEEIAFIAGEDIGDKFNLTKEFIELFKEAKTLGSLIKLNVYPHEFLKNRLEIIKDQPIDDLFLMETRRKSISILSQLMKQSNIMYNQYDVLITNPPYMSSKSMNTVLQSFLSKSYPDSKADLFASFMEIDQYLKDYGFYASINQHSWMFLSSFEKLREKLVCNKLIDSMLHLGPRAFEEIGGEVVQSTAFILRNTKIKGIEGVYIRLIDEKTSIEKKEKAIYAVQNPAVTYRYSFIQDKFINISGSPIVYWASDNVISAFRAGEPLRESANPRKGLATTDNSRFLRLWHEVSFSNLGIGYKDANTARINKQKWFPLNKGGSFRRWYGNKEYVINWFDNGLELKNAVVERYKGGSYTKEIRSEDKYFSDSITWSALTTNKLSFRHSDYGALFDSAGSSMFISEKSRNYFLGFLNTTVAESLMQMLNPTLNYGAGTVGGVPVIYSKEYEEKVNKLVEENIQISKSDWDTFETSWDFTMHPYLHLKKSQDKMLNGEMKQDVLLENMFKRWQEVSRTRFDQLKTNEEELNRIFIGIYSLQNELKSTIDDKDISICHANSTSDIKSFISFGVGCMFGRYSLDEERLVFAGGKFDLERYQTYTADEDNILPILSNGYFEDDIVSRFIEFINVTFGEGYLTENLEYIAGLLGKRDGETAKEVIRRYFLNDFFKDHLITYKKRPIYWLFTSGKQKAFNCLIYMHRYDKSTLSRIRTDYLHELQIRMETEKKSLLDVINGDGTTKEIANAKKELKSLDLKIEELRSYDEKLHHMADMQIEIDLDDGVAVNYVKFEGLLAPIK
ncbi:BREX-1 system adenine-specific DNA-methyltransferase PglX [Paenibacillus sp. DR312]|uniref:BREX-1 system adenine-specific DNA-methyltransferase PglX n=1 Tax=unclassified Paenibacillus TaxID=185978 RepID=UPI001C96B915|nr:BREX-1 system adenine-specific DNA-methyltransferase PglX [Paenibacillus sp. DR312]QZN76217.1 BREX-1 system adenine-specific DNA-methyltransferase PglX [Paenibacillus sp. DR312]